MICETFARFLDETWSLSVLDVYLQALLVIESRRLSGKVWYVS